MENVTETVAKLAVEPPVDAAKYAPAAAEIEKSVDAEAATGGAAADSAQPAAAAHEAPAIESVDRGAAPVEDAAADDGPPAQMPLLRVNEQRLASLLRQHSQTVSQRRTQL